MLAPYQGSLFFTSLFSSQTMVHLTGFICFNKPPTLFPPSHLRFSSSLAAIPSINPWFDVRQDKDFCFLPSFSTCQCNPVLFKVRAVDRSEEFFFTNHFANIHVQEIHLARLDSNPGPSAAMTDALNRSTALVP